MFSMLSNKTHSTHISLFLGDYFKWLWLHKKQFSSVGQNDFESLHKKGSPVLEHFKVIMWLLLEWNHSSSFNITWHDIWHTDAMTHAKPVTSDAPHAKPVTSDAPHAKPVTSDAPHAKPVTSDAPHAKPVTSDAQMPWHMPNLWHCHSACRTFGSDWHLPLGSAA